MSDAATSTPLQHPAVVYALALKDVAIADLQVQLLNAQNAFLQMAGPKAVEEAERAKTALEAAKQAMPVTDASALKVVA